MRATPQAAILFASLCIAAQADTITLIAPPGTYLAYNFSISETWLILGGTGSGSLIINSLPPFASGSASGDPDDALGAEATVYFLAFGQRYDSFIPGMNFGADALFPFTFGVPFTFESDVELTSNGLGGLGVPIAFASYDSGSGTYQIPPEAENLPDTPWGFYAPDDPGLSSVTLERNPASVPTPEPNLIWACLAGLVGIVARAFPAAPSPQGRSGGRFHTTPR